LRHSITTTNYHVSILSFMPNEEHLLPKHKVRKWVKVDALVMLPLTGLARKTLKRLALLPGNNSSSFPAKASALTKSKMLFPEQFVAE